MSQAEVAAVSPTLPHDLFHSLVIPDVLSEHLHLLLVSPGTPAWHPFYVLPLVSFAFRDTCQSLCVTIFGLESDDDGSVIGEILTFVQSLWTGTTRSPRRSRPLLEYTYAELMSSQSLIRVYVCAALAQSFLNVDVLWYLELESRFSELTDSELDDMASEDDLHGPHSGGSRRFRMRDDKMHRVYLPLTCAIKLCDTIRPQRLAYVVAGYLADIVPVYSTAPVMLKYSQDLETFVSRRYTIEMEILVNWTRQTLSLLEETEHLLKQMQCMGTLVESFKRSCAIPWEVLNATNIIQVLRDVAHADWGHHTEEISECTVALLHEWMPA